MTAPLSDVEQALVRALTAAILRALRRENEDERECGS